MVVVEICPRLDHKIRLALRLIQRIGLLLLSIDVLRLDHGDTGLIADDEHRVAPVTPVGVVRMQYMRLVVSRRLILRAHRNARAVIRRNVAAVEPFRLALGVGELILRQERSAVGQIGLPARGGILAVLARRHGCRDLRDRAVRAHGLRPDAGGRDDAVGLVRLCRVAHLRAHEAAVVRLLVDQQARTLNVHQYGDAGLAVLLQRLKGAVIGKLVLGRIAHFFKADPIRAVLLRAVEQRQCGVGALRTVDKVRQIIFRQLIGLRREAHEVRCEPELVLFLVPGVIGKARAQIKLRARCRNVVTVTLIFHVHAPVSHPFQIGVIYAVLQAAGQRQFQTGLIDIVVQNLLTVVRALTVAKFRPVDSRERQVACRGGRIERALSVILKDLIFCAVGRVVAQSVERLHNPELARREHADALVRAVCADVAAAVAVHGRHLVHIDLIAADRDENLARRRSILIEHLLRRPDAAVEAAILIAADIIRRTVDHSVVIVIEHAAVAVGLAILLDHIAVGTVKQRHIARLVSRDRRPCCVVRAGVRRIDPIAAAQLELEGDRAAVRDLDALEPLGGLIVIQLEAHGKIHHAAGNELIARDPIVRRDLTALRIAGVEIEAVLIARIAADLDVIPRCGADRHGSRHRRLPVGIRIPRHRGIDCRLEPCAVCHALDTDGQVFSERAGNGRLSAVFQILICNKRLRSAIVRDPIGIAPLAFHPAHSGGIELRLRIGHGKRKLHADVRLGIGLCPVVRLHLYAEIIGHRVKAANDPVVGAAVVTGLVILVPWGRAVGNCRDRNGMHLCIAAGRRCSGGRRSKSGKEAGQHRKR